MPRFREKDYVRFKNKKKTVCGWVEKVLPDELAIRCFAKGSRYVVPKTDVRLLEPEYIDGETYRKLVRFETSLYGTELDNAHENIINKDGYVPTLEDFLCVLKRIVREKIGYMAVRKKWSYYFLSCAYEKMDPNADNDFYNRYIVSKKAKRLLINWLYVDHEIDLSAVIAEIEAFLENEKKPLFERSFPTEVEVKLMRRYEDNAALDAASDTTATVYKKFAEELCKEGNRDGLLAVGYGCYGGNRVFPCDWKRAEKCMLKLFETVREVPDRAFYANTLGYIYYYGRCNDGVPEYEKAYKYFSFAAFNQVFEAEYKIADMFQKGRGVAKSPETAEYMIRFLYNDTLSHFKRGRLSSKFADVALRMGGFCKNEEFPEKSDYKAMLRYYYQAEFAIRLRTKEYDFYGDERVREDIEAALEKAKSESGFKPSSKAIYSVGDFFKNCLSGELPLDIKPKKMANGKYKLTIMRHENYDSRSRRLFVTIPELDMCGFYDSLTVTLVSQRKDSIICPEEPFSIDEVISDAFFLDSYVKVMFEEQSVIEIRKPKESEKLYRFAFVQHDSEDRISKNLCGDESIEAGDKVDMLRAHQTPRGTVTRVFEEAENEVYFRPKTYKRIRKCSDA